MDINGASAIVTGGASGIGAATARLLAAKGAKVVIADLRGASLSERRERLIAIAAPEHREHLHSLSSR